MFLISKIFLIKQYYNKNNNRYLFYYIFHYTRFNKEIKDSKICESFKNYLNHFKDLDSITQSNKAKYDEIIKKINNNTNFDVEDVLFLIYMERNAFYHGGEAAKSGTNYSFKQNLLNFYVVFLRYFIAEYGIKMFNKELEL